MDTMPTDKTLDYEEWKRAMYAERGRRVREALEQRCKQGKPIGCAPVGYRNAVVDGKRVIVLDEQMATLVRETFELFATGLRTTVVYRQLPVQWWTAYTSARWPARWA